MFYGHWGKICQRQGQASAGKHHLAVDSGKAATLPRYGEIGLAKNRMVSRQKNVLRDGELQRKGALPP